MAYKKLTYALDGNIAVITMNDPATLNAAGVDMVIEVRDAFAPGRAGSALRGADRRGARLLLRRQLVRARR